MEFKDSFYLLVQMFNGYLAITLNNILGIFKLESVTPIPNNKNKYILGITNAKGHIVPVIDMRIEKEGLQQDILVVMETPQGKKGVIFKKLEGVIHLLKEEMEKGKFIKGPFPYLEIEKNSKKIILADLTKNYEFYDLETAFEFDSAKAS
jgi:chemotaxis signal transduction protein